MKAGVWAVVALIMAGLYGLDQGLAALESREVSLQAHRAFEHGRQAMQEGNFASAVDFLTRAHAMERDDRDYLVALATAQRKDGRFTDARQSLALLLASDSNDAEANLEMARLLAGEKEYTGTYSFYHRALFGNGMKDPVKVRLELAEQLAQQGRNRELLAELLLLEKPAEADPAVARTVAGLFLKAGSPDRAVQMYRALLRIDSGDRDAERGLGEVELDKGNFGAAQSAFARAGDRAKEQLSAGLAALDPTVRRISSAEKYARSARLLQMTAEACGKTLDAKASGKASPKAKTSGNEDAEALLDDASEMWKAGDCKDPSGVIFYIEKKLAQ